MQSNWAWDRPDSDSNPKPWQGQWEKYDDYQLEDSGGNWDQFNNDVSAPYDEFENIMRWDDSAALEAFQIARERYEAYSRGLTYPLPLPDPDLYIQPIDWDSHGSLDLPNSGDTFLEYGRKTGQRKRGRKGGGNRGNKQFDSRGYGDYDSKKTVSKIESHSKWDDGHNYHIAYVPPTSGKKPFYRHGPAEIRNWNQTNASVSQYYSHGGLNDTCNSSNNPSLGRPVHWSQGGGGPPQQSQQQDDGRCNWAPPSSQQTGYKWQPTNRYSGSRDCFPKKDVYGSSHGADLPNNHFTGVTQPGQYEANKHAMQYQSVPQPVHHGNYMHRLPENAMKYSWDRH